MQTQVSYYKRIIQFFFERAIVKYLNKYTFNNITESICTVTPLKIFVQLHPLK